MNKFRVLLLLPSLAMLACQNSERQESAPTPVASAKVTSQDNSWEILPTCTDADFDSDGTWQATGAADIFVQSVNQMPHCMVSAEQATALFPTEPAAQSSASAVMPAGYVAESSGGSIRTSDPMPPRTDKTGTAERKLQNLQALRFLMGR